MGILRLRTDASTWVDLTDTDGSALPESGYGAGAPIWFRASDTTWHRGVDHYDINAHPLYAMNGPRQLIHFSDAWYVAAAELNRAAGRYLSDQADSFDDYSLVQDFVEYREELYVVGQRILSVASPEGVDPYYRRAHNREESWLCIDWDLLRSHRRFTHASLTVEFRPSYERREFAAGQTYTNPNTWTELSAPTTYNVSFWLADVTATSDVVAAGRYEWAEGEYGFVAGTYPHDGGSGTLLETFNAEDFDGINATRTYDLGDVSGESYRIYQLTCDAPTPFDAADVPGVPFPGVPDYWVGYRETVSATAENIVLKLT